MRLEPATISDASRISALILGLSTPFFTSPSREGAESFLASTSETAIEGYLSASNFEYFVAEAQSQLVGVIALRDNSHLFQLFVAEAFQGRGIGRKLWQTVKAKPSHLVTRAALRSIQASMRCPSTKSSVSQKMAR